MSALIAALSLAALTAWGSPPAELPSSLDLSRVRSIVVQHDGRWMPLDTLARDLVQGVTGERLYRGRDPVLVLLAWTLDPQAWRGAPLIHIRNAELRGELQLSASRTVYSYEELIGHERLLSLVDQLSRIESGRKANPLESKVSGIHGKLITLQRIFHGQGIRPVPDPGDALGAWRSVAWFTQVDAEELRPVRAAWESLRGAFQADDRAAFDHAAGELAGALEALPAAHRPPPQLLATELRYNELRPFRKAWVIMILGTVLAAAAMRIRRRWFDGLTLLAFIAGFGLLTYGLSMRGTIAGRLPAANMYESLLFLSCGTGAFAILAMFFVRHRSVPLTASAMGALSLCLADTLPIDQFIRPIAPVLMDTVWMSIHVPIIMLSYSVLTLAVLIAHVQVAVMAAAPGRRELEASIDSAHAWYMHVGALLLFVGIATGSMWAASSWGRYWGWDPKEVWSLVAFLGYMAIMHVRVDKEQIPAWARAAGALLGLGLFLLVGWKLGPPTMPLLVALAAAGGAMAFFVTARGRFATAAKSILAFWMIIMTYVGVNYVLGIGLHSYGFGTGAIASRVFLIGTLDLAFVVLCGVLHGWRSVQART